VGQLESNGTLAQQAVPVFIYFILFLMCSPGSLNVQGGVVDALGWVHPDS